MHELQFRVLFVYVNIHQIKPEATKISKMDVSSDFFLLKNV
jgi:hypothetical protein